MRNGFISQTQLKPVTTHRIVWKSAGSFHSVSIVRNVSVVLVCLSLTLLHHPVHSLMNKIIGFNRWQTVTIKLSSPVKPINCLVRM